MTDKVTKQFLKRDFLIDLNLFRVSDQCLELCVYIMF